ncbi:hypothetical protein [Nonomuraea wenchangensis]|uniref:hypothetical protein n=1 Tax=Nonomuraea wenchangensis TaxID=568860 RepID=UPI00331664D1
MRYVITTPEPHFTGEVAGVAFAHGRAETTDPAPRVIAYFLRKGYGVQPVDGKGNPIEAEDAVVQEVASSPGAAPGPDTRSPLTAEEKAAIEAENKDADGADGKDADTKRSTTSRRTTKKEGEQ